MNLFAERSPPNEEARQASLKRQSDDHLLFAFKGGSQAASAAFQAGYCALLSALSAGQISVGADKLGDHDLPFAWTDGRGSATRTPQSSNISECGKLSSTLQNASTDLIKTRHTLIKASECQHPRREPLS